MKKKILKNLVAETILIYMSKGFAFTAMDICNHIRAENPHTVIRYREVSTMVKKQTLNIAQSRSIQYNATLQKIDTANGMNLAYLYHGINFDPEDYLARDQTTLQTLQTA